MCNSHQRDFPLPRPRKRFPLEMTTKIHIPRFRCHPPVLTDTVLGHDVGDELEEGIGQIHAGHADSALRLHFIRGLVATAAGNHCGARQVARILYSSSDKYGLPWHRVVNQKREISPRNSGTHLKQKQMLEAEGVVFDGNERISFDLYLWLPRPG